MHFSSLPFQTHIIFDLIISLIFDEKYRLWSSSCNFLQPPVPLTLLGPNILLSTLFSASGLQDFFMNCFSYSGDMTATDTLFTSNIISIDQKLICPIQFQCLLIFLDVPNGIYWGQV
jgi:hypothetical protein